MHSWDDLTDDSFPAMNIARLSPHPQRSRDARDLNRCHRPQEMTSHPFKPAICPESAKIHSESNKGSFLQRVARDAARKEHEAGRQQARNAGVGARRFFPCLRLLFCFL